MYNNNVHLEKELAYKQHTNKLNQASPKDKIAPIQGLNKQTKKQHIKNKNKGTLLWWGTYTIGGQQWRRSQQQVRKKLGNYLIFKLEYVNFCQAMVGHISQTFEEQKANWRLRLIPPATSSLSYVLFHLFGTRLRHGGTFFSSGVSNSGQPRPFPITYATT